MKKRILTVLIFAFCISMGISAGELADIVYEELSNEILMALYPYNGSYDVNLRDGEHYPARDENSSVSFDGASGKPATGSEDSSKYFDFQMVAHGIIEGIPIGFLNAERHLNDGTIYRVRDFRVPSMTITVDCPSDFMFVSQSDTSYKRPFELYVIPKYSHGNRVADEAVKEVNPILIDDSLPHSIDYPAANPSGDYAGLWFDLILGLPGEMDDNGVTYKNVYYPLSDATDYTALVNITIEWEVNYNIDVYWAFRGWKHDDSGTFTLRQTISIPFSGYCSFEAPAESVGSLYISTTTESQNINLNPDYIEPVKVADISYLYNFGHGDQIGDVTEDVNKTWLFLSASPDPWSNSDSNIFRMYHVSAGSEADEYNSIPFMVYVEDTDGSNQYVEFTGNEDAYDFSPVTADGGSSDFIKTKCNNEKSRSDSYSGGEYHPVQYYHYHSFDGEVWVEVMPQTDLMAAGRYIGDIYVHVIVEA